MADICKFDGSETEEPCNRTDIRGHGWCGKHYMRWYQHGDPSIVKPRGGSTRFKKGHETWNKGKKIERSVIECQACGEEVEHLPSRHPTRKFCSIECRSQVWNGETHPSWKEREEMSLTTQGYIRGDSGKALHREIAERALGRPLKSTEHVHHVNGDKADNRNENLLVCSNSYHHWLHNRMADLYMKEHFS